MKKILAMAAVAALAVGASAYAANPFSDVSPSDWAYQAVSDLSDRGLIDGYPDGSFGGQRNITRFEVAQIVARLMAKEDQMHAEDRAIVDRLASEYGAELENLGVRVNNLEKKIGNVRWTGDARLLFGHQNVDADGASKNNYLGRIRLEAHADVNDTTYVHGRLLAEADLGDSDEKGGDVSMDRLHVHHQFGRVGATLGRYELDLGQQLGGWLYSNAFDGIEVAAPLNENVALSLGYGRMKEAYNSKSLNWVEDNGTVTKNTISTSFPKSEIFYAQLKADFKVAKVGFDYFKASPYTYTTPGEDPVSRKKSVWGINLLIPVQDFRVFGDYYADTQKNPAYDNQKGKIWTVGVGYGEMDLKKAGSFGLDIAYFRAKSGLYEFGMTGADASSVDQLLMENGHFWLASGDVALAKNTYLHGEYAFGAKHDDKEYSKEYANSWVMSLNYVF